MANEKEIISAEKDTLLKIYQTILKDYENKKPETFQNNEIREEDSTVESMEVGAENEEEVVDDDDLMEMVNWVKDTRTPPKSLQKLLRILYRMK